ncbi:3439_t:CDS:2, partial [Funneliformis mosseae]
LSLEEALLCIPPPITYSPKCTLTGPDCVYSRRPTDATGILDFNCHRAELLILVMEAKRKHVLEDMGEQTLSKFYHTGKSKDVVQQIYNYMGENELRYGILTTYDNYCNQLSSSAFGVSSNTFVKQNNYSFSDFKFKSILGEGRSGKTLLCEFRGDMIALKSADLSKAPSYVLEEMQKEVEMYKDLADIQGKYIPKLVCYGYYEGGMSFVIGLTIVGNMLSDQKIMEQQKTRVIKGLEAIHKHGILYNDIWEKNILINDNDDIYLIDFGMTSRADTKKKRKLFEEE